MIADSVCWNSIFERNVSNTKVIVEITWNENRRKNPVQCGNNWKHQSKLPVTMVNSRLFAQKALFVAPRKSRMRIDVMEVCSIIGCFPNWSLAKKKHVFFVSNVSRKFTHSNFEMCVCWWHILKFENAAIDASNVSQWILVKINIHMKNASTPAKWCCCWFVSRCVQLKPFKQTW